MTNYKPRKVHFANSAGLHLCQAKRSFVDALQMSTDMADVTCVRCLQGKRSQAWRKYLGVDEVTFNCGSCGRENIVSHDNFKKRMRAARTKLLYCDISCQARKTPKKITVVN